MRKSKKLVFLFCLLFFLFSPFFIPHLFSQVGPPDALQAFRDGNYERSVQICLDEINANPNNMESHVVITWSLIRLSRFPEALRYAIAGRNINRYDLRITESLGEISYFMGQNEEALRYFQEYLSMATDGVRLSSAYYYMGEVLMRLGRFRHADIALSTAVHWVPGNANWWTRLAYARENAGELHEAAVAYERALSMNAQLADAQRGLERVRQSLARP